MDHDAARLRAFEVILDPSEYATEHSVSLPTLKKLCARGIPDRPVQWRPLAWEVLLGVRSREKGEWEQAERERWARYYELVQQTTSALINPEHAASAPEQDIDLLAIDDNVRALAATERGKWLRRSIKYPRGHPFTDEQADGNAPGGESEGALPVVDDCRGILRHIQRLRARPTEPENTLDPSTVSPSPEITLSPAPTDASRHPTRQLRGPRRKPSAGPKNKNDLALDIPGSVPEATIIVTAASPTTSDQPITLIPSRALDKTKAHERNAGGGAMDTLADGLVRLLSVLPPPTRRRLDDPGQIVELAGVLYAVFATGGDVEALMKQSDEWEVNDHAEAETFWCLQALINDQGLQGLFRERGLQEASTRLAKRVFWADQGLYRLLMALHLDLRNDVFVTGWLSHLLAQTIQPTHQLLPLWDAILSEDEDPATLSPETTGKTELLIDILTAMLLLVKDMLRSIVDNHDRTSQGQGGFWIEGEQDRLLFDEDVPDLPADQAEEKTVAARRLLSAYPIDQVGIEEVLRIAWEVRQQRIMAILDGEDLQAIVLPEVQTSRPEVDGLASRLESLAMKAGSSVRDSINPLPKYTAAPLVDIDSVKNTLATSGERLKDYAYSLQESDTAARVSKVSSNLTAVALMRLNSLTSSAKQHNGDSTWTIGAATKLWSGGGKTEEQAVNEAARPAESPPAQESVDLAEQPINDEPAALFRRDTNLPPSFITPRGSIIYPAGRYRPKASTTGQAKPSLQSRLAAVASSPAAQPAVAGSPERSSVRPLILSRSAKPASPLHVMSDVKSPAALGRMSPSPSLQTLDVVENYVPRRVSVSRRSQRSSMGTVDRDEATGAVGGDSTSARLRKATRDSYTASADTRRYHLSDPGAVDEEKPTIDATVADTPSDVEKYQLHDGVNPPSEQAEPGTDSRRESVDGASTSGVTRSKVVRKGKFASKAAHIRLQSAGHIDVGEEQVKATGALDPADEQLPTRTSSLSQPATPVAGAAETSPLKSLILPERPERSSSLQNRTSETVQRPTVDVQGLQVVRGEDGDEPLSAKDGYGDLLESYAAALEIL